MIGCHIGRMFQVTVAGGSYQEGLTAVIQGHPPAICENQALMSCPAPAKSRIYQ